MKALSSRHYRWIYTMLFLLIILFTISSLFYKTYNSSELSTQTKATSNQSRTDYIDQRGQITFAADKGYATVVKDIEDVYGK